MDSTIPSRTESSSRSVSKSTASVRQPLSCEPCRKRKIKCSRTSAPCNACRRRQCSESCIYLGVNDNSGANQELLTRIDNLEKMLRKYTGTSQSQAQSASNNNAANNSLRGPMLSPPMDITAQSYDLSPESLNYDLIHRQSESSFSPRSPAVQHVGELRSSAAGDVQYEPRSAQWTAVLANTGITAPMLDEVQEAGETGTGFPFSAGPVPSRDELLATLPPMRHCDYLKETYFDIFSPLFHILHDPSFLAKYEAFVNDDSTASLSWLAVLFVILSLAVTSLEDNDPVLRDLARGPDPATNIRALSKRYRDAAMKCLANQGVFRGKHNIQSLQALILLGYAMSHSQEHTWVLLGMTYHVAIALACHIDPSNFDLNPIQCEERRRCWAGLMMLYTIQNAFLGNPEPNRHLNHTVQLPVDANDVDITVSGVHPSAAGPTQVSYLLFKFQLYNLTATICQEIFSNTPASRQAVSALDQQICLAQESWDARYAVDSATAPLPANHRMNLNILQAYAHQLFLLLHRPFFAQSVIGLDVPNESQIRCIASADALLDIHRLIHETPEYRPYAWYSNGLGSFHAFHAAVVLAVALLMPIYKPQYRKFRKILEDTLDRFEKLKARSVICQRAAKVVGVLLTLPSPNQPLQAINSNMTAISAAAPPLSSKASRERFSTDEIYTDWDMSSTEQMRFFAERLQPQQWISPTSIDWNEWDKVLDT